MATRPQGLPQWPRASTPVLNAVSAEYALNELHCPIKNETPRHEASRGAPACKNKIYEARLVHPPEPPPFEPQ